MATKEKPRKADYRTDKRLIGHGYCPFCGKSVKNKEEIYCRRCIDEHYDNVHMTFGTTNGWDRAPRRVFTLRSGWRGRRVSGRLNEFKA